MIRSTDESWSNSNRSFVEVSAGAAGFVMVTTMPEADEWCPFGGEVKKAKNARSLSPPT